MPLKPSNSVTTPEFIAAQPESSKPLPMYNAPMNKDTRILYQGLTQAALQSMPLGQFAPDLDTHLINVKLAVDAMAAFVLERSK